MLGANNPLLVRHPSSVYTLPRGRHGHDRLTVNCAVRRYLDISPLWPGSCSRTARPLLKWSPIWLTASRR